ncbi:MAG: hypothetical protein M3Q03_17175 [Chloroflexota bacterium]|nr:hypothetical protein [Chloroflexota bacterium]
MELRRTDGLIILLMFIHDKCRRELLGPDVMVSSSPAGCVYSSASICLRWTDRDETASPGAEDRA